MIPTVKISDGGGGFWIINQSDFDPQHHTLYSPVDQAAILRAKSVPQLRALASDLRIPGRSKMNEEQLITAILEAGHVPDKLPD